MVADEPTGDLDREASQPRWTLWVKPNRVGPAILMATHDLNLVRAAKAQAPARLQLVAVTLKEGFDAKGLLPRLEGEVPGATPDEHGRWRSS